MDFHGTFNKLIISKGSGSHLPACRLGAHIRWHSSQICPVLGCLHGDGSHASTEIQHLLPRAQLGEVEHQAGRGKTWAKSSTQNVHDFHPRSCISRKKTLNLLQHHALLHHSQHDDSFRKKMPRLQDFIDLPSFPHESPQHFSASKKWCFYHLSPFCSCRFFTGPSGANAWRRSDARAASLVEGARVSWHQGAKCPTWRRRCQRSPGPLGGRFFSRSNGWL